MEQPKKNMTAIYVLIIAAIIIVAGILFYVSKNNSPTATSSSESLATTTASVYVNSVYGFTFNYPPSWKLTESADKTTMTVDAGITANGLDAFTLVFTIIQNNAFQEAQTKVGDINYDPTQNALVDENETPARCLPYAPLRGLAGGAGTLEAFNYGGSIMSDTAYWESEILTNKNYMLDVGESV